MLAKVLKLKAIRELRVAQARRDTQAARAALAQAQATVEAIHAERAAAEAEVARLTRPADGVGGTVSAADIERRLGMARQVEAYLGVLERRRRAAEAARAERERALAAAVAAQKAAERSVEQIGVLETRVADEETRRAEMLEEMGDETRTKPRLDPGGGS